MIGVKRDSYSSPFDSLALAYDSWFEEEGKVISTLFQEPDKVEHGELPRRRFSPDAGFVIIIAGDNPSAR